ncbi:hypothetical protein [Streptomyces indicus]|uniref:Uncharacterized protein n=1 Tax=Streptomyces indicus TaxID=417292 RepID=A0A1G9JKU0_9ACTN|nr:hypothetical protein [Streptomyces indicus]SDL38108.1 hypothetical protein SAMN05421806_13222 [Streptomyces indicus]
MDQPEPDPQASELLPAPSRAELPLVPVYDEAAALLTPEARSLAEEIIAVSRFSPDTLAALFVGHSRTGKTRAAAVTLAQLDAAGIPYEESDDGHGQTIIRTRPAGAESPKE